MIFWVTNKLDDWQHKVLFHLPGFAQGWWYQFWAPLCDYVDRGYGASPDP